MTVIGPKGCVGNVMFISGVGCVIVMFMRTNELFPVRYMSMIIDNASITR